MKQLGVAISYIISIVYVCLIVMPLLYCVQMQRARPRRFHAGIYVHAGGRDRDRLRLAPCSAPDQERWIVNLAVPVSRGDLRHRSRRARRLRREWELYD